MLDKQQEEEVIALCKKLIQAKSYSGEEQEVSLVLSTFFKEHKFDQVHVDEYGNTIGVMKGKRPGKRILFDGHMDTVPVEDASRWKEDPFSGKIIDGKMYGRGTTDMKGAIAAMANAAVHFAEFTKGDFPGEIYVAGVVHEECFEGVAARKISEWVNPDYVIIGEASTLNVKIGQRGRAEIKIETFGVPAHSANPEKGINAVYHMCKVVDRVRNLVPNEHPVLGKGILELVDIKSSPYPGASVVPEYCCATYDRRLLTGETKESVLAPIEALLEELREEEDSLQVKVSYATGKETCYTGKEITGERFFPGWLFDQEEEYIKKVMNQLQHMGFSPSITQYNFCTNGSHYAGEKQIKTLGMGPSVESLAHTIDEYIELEQLLSVTECYFGIMQALLAE